MVLQKDSGDREGRHVVERRCWLVRAASSVAREKGDRAPAAFEQMNVSGAGIGGPKVNVYCSWAVFVYERTVTTGCNRRG